MENNDTNTNSSHPNAVPPHNPDSSQTNSVAINPTGDSRVNIAKPQNTDGASPNSVDAEGTAPSNNDNPAKSSSETAPVGTKSKKKIAIALTALALVVVGYFAAMFYTSKKIEEMVTEQYQKIKTINADIVTQEKYERGLFQSRDIALVKIPDFTKLLSASDGDEAENAEAKPQPIEFRMETVITHGPLVRSGIGAGQATIRFIPTETSKALFQKWFNGKEPYITEVIGFDKSHNGHMIIPAFNFPMESGSISGDATNLAYSTTMDGKKLSASLPPTNFSVNSSVDSVKFEGMSFATTQELLGENLLSFSTGNTKIQINKLSMINEHLPIEIQNINFENQIVKNRDNAGLVNYNYLVTANKANFKDFDAAPFELKLQINRVSIAAMEAFNQANLNMMSAEKSDSAPEPKIEVYNNLLKENPEINIDKLSFKTPEGEINANMNIKTKGLFIDDFEKNKDEAMKKLTVDSTISMPKEHLNFILLILGINPMDSVQNGWVTEEDKIGKTHLQLKDGKLFMNDKEIPSQAEAKKPEAGKPQAKRHKS